MRGFHRRAGRRAIEARPRRTDRSASLGARIPELKGRKLPSRFYLRPTLRVARELLGKILVRRLRGRTLAGVITEVEAYLGEKDPASHAYRGPTPRNSVMFGEGGYLYVYFTYGMHHCCNVVTDRTGRGRAVLLRCIRPVEGILTMRRLRQESAHSAAAKSGPVDRLTDGPGKLCQALGISLKDNGVDLTGEDIFILDAPKPPAENIVRTGRIGISRARDKLWRFSLVL